LDFSCFDGDQEALAEALAALEGKAAIYHCVSRVVNRERVFKRAERDEFVRLMRRYEAFSQVHVETYCVLSNHFHILVEVPASPEDGGASWSDERLLKHLELIYDERKMAELRWELTHLRSLENEQAAEEWRARFFRRMWDLSEFMKILKQSFTQWFNRRHGRCGVLWEERFKSELVEEGHAAQRVAAYIDLNPVRAGLVADPKDWRWSGYGEAVAGKKAAQEGLQRVLFEEAATRMSEGRAAREVADAKQVLRDYRMVLFADGEEHLRDERKKRAGIARERVARVLARGGKLSEAELAFCRTRYFLDGVAIGSEHFVNHVFTLLRESFGGANRKSGARRMRRVESTLCTLRDLQKDALSC
jgi:REP element-mobilizing transposase RayT